MARKSRGLGLSPEQHLDEVSRQADKVYEHVQHGRNALDAKRCDVALVQFGHASAALGRVMAHSRASGQPERYANEMGTAHT